MRYTIVDSDTGNTLSEDKALNLFLSIFIKGVDLGNWQFDEWGMKRDMPPVFDEIKEDL